MKCVFLSTGDEYVECFKECGFYKWSENNNKCPFKDLGGKRTAGKQKYNYDEYKDDSEMKMPLFFAEQDYF